MREGILKKLFVVLGMVLKNPLNKPNRLMALIRFVKWQFGSRLVPGKVLVPWVNDSRIFSEFMMPGSAGCAYSGLHEFEEMAFCLHFLRKEDLFVDVGANVGVFTVLAGKAIGARCVSVEPGDEAFACLQDNISINEMDDSVDAIHACISDKNASCFFVKSKESTLSHIATAAEEGNSSRIETKRLDSILLEQTPALMKIDVEGHEKQALRGASETLKSEKLKAIIIEVGAHSWRYNIDPAEIHELLAQNGFQSHRYDPFTRKLAKTEIDEVQDNSLYIRDITFVENRLQSAKAFKIMGQEI